MCPEQWQSLQPCHLSYREGPDSQNPNRCTHSSSNSPNKPCIPTAAPAGSLCKVSLIEAKEDTTSSSTIRRHENDMPPTLTQFRANLRPSITRQSRFSSTAPYGKKQFSSDVSPNACDAQQLDTKTIAFFFIRKFSKYAPIHQHGAVHYTGHGEVCKMSTTDWVKCTVLLLLLRTKFIGLGWGGWPLPCLYLFYQYGFHLLSHSLASTHIFLFPPFFTPVYFFPSSSSSISTMAWLILVTPSEKNSKTRFYFCVSDKICRYTNDFMKENYVFHLFLIRKIFRI